MRREMPGRATLYPPSRTNNGGAEKTDYETTRAMGATLVATSRETARGRVRGRQRWGEAAPTIAGEADTNSLTAFRIRGGRGRRRRSSVRRSPLSLPQSTSRPPPLTLAYVSYITLLHLILRHISFLPLSLNVRRRRGRQFCHCICSSDPREPH